MLMFPNGEVAAAFKTNLTTIGLIRQIFRQKGCWEDEQVPDWAVYLVSLHSMLSQCGINPETILLILSHFTEELYQYGQATEEERKVASLLQLMDNRYVSLIDIPKQTSRRVLDLTTVSVTPKIPTPLLVVSIVLPKLYYLSLQALSISPGPRDEAGVLRGS